MQAAPDDHPEMMCPDRLARAPRVSSRNGTTAERLVLPPPALQGAIAAIVCRDTRALNLSSAQRLTHFPASPLVCLSWFQGFNSGLVEQGSTGPVWRRFESRVLISGSQSQPTVSWTPTTGRGGMVLFPADVAKTLLGLDLSEVHDRFVPAHQALAGHWQPFLSDFANAPDDSSTLAVLEQHLAPRWQALQGRNSSGPSLRQLGRHWVERLGLQANGWRQTHSPRQVERRIKAFSGRSMREWQSLVKTEGLFFAAKERHESGAAIDWADLAVQEGFSDQAHLIRMAKRTTGFAPSEFASRYIEDESFWAYRLWA